MKLYSVWTNLETSTMLFHTKGDQTPYVGTTGSAGFDLVATEDVLLLPNQPPFMMPLNFHTEFHSSIMVGLLPRSSLGKKGMYLCGTLGVIDSDYRGNWMAGLCLHSWAEPLQIHKGDKIVQVVQFRIREPETEEVPDLTDTARGYGGHGSTGR